MRNHAMLSALVLLVAARVAGAQEVLVDFGEDWRYFPGTEAPSDPAGDWRLPDFDDSLWETGAAGFGYGDGDDATALEDMPGSYLAVYIRKRIDVPDPGALRTIILEIDYDDGFVAYVNGVETARANMGAPGQELPHDAPATGLHEAGFPQQFGIDAELFVSGENVIAIEGRNISLQSSDFTLSPRVVANVCPEFTARDFRSIENDAMSISWSPVPFDRIEVTRNGEPIPGSPFPAGTSRVLDPAPAFRDFDYRLVGYLDDVECDVVERSISCCDRRPGIVDIELELAGGRTRAVLGWTPPPDATSARIIRKGLFLADIDPTAASFVDPDVESLRPESYTDYRIVYRFDDDEEESCTLCTGKVSLCPELFQCEIRRNGPEPMVRIAWGNMVKAWRGFGVQRDGQTITVGLPADATEFVDLAPTPGATHIYTLVPGSSAGSAGCQRSCSVGPIPCFNSAPVASAEALSARIDLCGARVTLDASSSHDGNRGQQGLTYRWEKENGPDGDEIVSPGSPRTDVVFSQPGSYTYLLIVDDGGSCESEADDAVSVEVEPCIVPFLRGDADGDGIVTLSDSIRIFGFLFLRFAPPGCPDAADGDDDGRIDLADGVRILEVLFLGEGAVPLPGLGACGPDPSEDTLGDCGYERCP